MLAATGVPSPTGTFTPLVKAETVYDGFGRPVVARSLSASNAIASVSQTSYDAAGRVDCATVRMNPSAWGSLPSSACTAQTAGGDGPDRIVQATYDALGRPLSTTSAVGQAEALTESTTYTTNDQVQTLTESSGKVPTTACKANSLGCLTMSEVWSEPMSAWAQAGRLAHDHLAAAGRLGKAPA